MATKRARTTSTMTVTSVAHPFMLFPSSIAYQERCHGFIGRTILTGRTLDWAAVQTLGVESEVRRILDVLPYSRVFIVTEPTYLELVCEFYASFACHQEQITFRLGGIDRSMSMAEFGVALGIWQRDELDTPAYTTAVRDFTPADVSTAWAQICMTGVPYQHGFSKATGIYPTLRYLHAIIAHTLSGRRTAPGTVTQMETFLLANMHMGFTVEMARLITVIMRGFATDTRKQCLGLGPFITRIARYLELDIEGSELTMVAPTTVPTDFTILRNMGMVVRDASGRYTIHTDQPGQASASEAVPAHIPPSETFVPRTAFERHMSHGLAELSARYSRDMDRIDRRLATMDDRIDRRLAVMDDRIAMITSRIEEIHQQTSRVAENFEFDLADLGPLDGDPPGS